MNTTSTGVTWITKFNYMSMIALSATVIIMIIKCDCNKFTCNNYDCSK